MQQVQQVERYSKTIDLMTVDKFPVNIMMEHTLHVMTAWIV